MNSTHTSCMPMSRQNNIKLGKRSWDESNGVVKRAIKTFPFFEVKDVNMTTQVVKQVYILHLIGSPHSQVKSYLARVIGRAAWSPCACHCSLLFLILCPRAMRQYVALFRTTAGYLWAWELSSDFSTVLTVTRACGHECAYGTEKPFYRPMPSHAPKTSYSTTTQTVFI